MSYLNNEKLPKTEELMYNLLENLSIEQRLQIVQEQLLAISDQATECMASNCVLTMFGKCSYELTGCADCEIKKTIQKALAKPANNLVNKDELLMAIRWWNGEGYEVYHYVKKVLEHMEKEENRRIEERK